MGLRGLLQLKKEEKKSIQISYKKYLFIGEDFYTLSLLSNFLKKFPHDEIALVNTRPIEKDHLRIIGPSKVRGEANIKVWKKYWEKKLNKIDESIEVSPEFFKDQDFRRFDGRHKSQTVLPDEQFYLQKGLRLNHRSSEKSYFADEIAEMALKLSEINNLLKRTQVVSIKKAENSDFISPVHFEVKLASGEVITCENLFFGPGPYKFLELFQDKNLLSSEAIEFCEERKEKHAILVRFYLAQKISDKEETLYISYSVTHELGHIIAEFNRSEGENVGGKNCEQYLDTLMALDPEHTDEETVSKNIRLLRKNIERAFPSFEKNILKEFILVTDQLGRQNIDDFKFENAKNDFKNVFFLGENTSISKSALAFDYEDSVDNVSMLVRGTLGLEQIQQLFLKN